MQSSIEHSSATAGDIAKILRRVGATTQPQLVEMTGASRSTVAHRVDQLLASGLVVEDGQSASTGGRPATRLRFNQDYGVVLVGDLGVTRSRAAVTDLACATLSEEQADIAVDDGPDALLHWLSGRFETMLAEIGRSDADVVGIGIGLPGPVDHDAGRVVSPPIMPGWNGYLVSGYFVERYGAPTLVDNDVNVMALGEYRAYWQERIDELLFVKVGMGIGCGIVASGTIQRGAQGVAGDIGHVHVAGHDDAMCSCGRTGCVGAVSSGGAMAARLRATGREVPDARALVALVDNGDRQATRLICEAGQVLGQVLATAVNIANPSVIVVGGDVAAAGETLLAGLRDVIHRRSTPLATRQLQIVRSRLGESAGIRGASVMAVDHVLAPAAVDAAIATAGSSRGRRHAADRHGTGVVS